VVHIAIITDKDAAELQRFVPHLERVHITGAGHCIRREQFGTYMKVVNAFLAQSK